MPRTIDTTKANDPTDVVVKALKAAPGSITAPELARSLGIPVAHVRPALAALVLAGKAFRAGNRRSSRFGSTQNKANVWPINADPSGAGQNAKVA